MDSLQIHIKDYLAKKFIFLLKYVNLLLITFITNNIEYPQLAKENKMTIRRFPVRTQTQVIISGVDAQVQPLDNSRRYLIIQNQGPNEVYLRLDGKGAAATGSNGEIKLVADEKIVFDVQVPTNEIRAISAGTSDLAILIG